MVVFNGSIKIQVVEAVNLRPTEASRRFNNITSAQRTPAAPSLDPYVSVDIDELHVGSTGTKSKTLSPSWNEEITAEVHNGQHMGFTIFHDSVVPPDDFVANCQILFEDLEVNQQLKDIWVRPAGSPANLHLLLPVSTVS